MISLTCGLTTVLLVDKKDAAVAGCSEANFSCLNALGLGATLRRALVHGARGKK